MKTITNIRLTKQNMIFCLLVTALLFTFSSCAKKITFQNSSVVPAARGKVSLNTDKNKNYVIKMELTYLAEPSRLSPPKTAYVVWMTDQENNTNNIGQVKTSGGLKVSFETVTPSKPVKIFITAEDDPTVQYPGMTLVLETTNF